MSTHKFSRRTFLRGVGVTMALIVVTLGCDVKVGVQAHNSRSYTFGGVKYVVPIETSSHQEMPGRFTYTGDSVSFSDTAGTLVVNGKNYGAVKAGDIVDLTKTRKVVVNGSERSTQ